MKHVNNVSHVDSDGNETGKVTVALDITLGNQYIMTIGKDIKDPAPIILIITKEQLLELLGGNVTPSEISGQYHGKRGSTTL